MGYFKLAGGVIGALALAFLLWAAKDRFRLADEVRGYEACTAAVRSTGDPLTACKPAVAAVAQEARRARTCEEAAGQGDAGRYALRASCGENVKRLDAQLSAATATAADLTSQLNTERSGRLDAIARAEARAGAQAARRATRDETIRNQPRAPDGRVRCDAQCLRLLGGDAAAADPGPGG